MRCRRFWIAVACTLLVSMAFAQVAKRRPESKGPRALGLVEVDSQGSGRLVPVVIMVDGKFYDAGVYKADPVPMALQPGTIYEAVKSGVSQGLFTVNNPLPQKGWLGLGSWKTNEQITAEKEQAQTRATKLAEKHEDDIKAGGPPRLSRTPESAQPEKAGTAASKSTESAPPRTTDEDADRPVLKKPTPTPPGASDVPSDNSERPVLRRQSAGEAQQQTKVTPEITAMQGKFDVIPAISDADGPQPRPYTYQTKADEDREFMKKMAAMAADEVKRRLELLSPAETKPKGARAAPAPELRDQQLKILDISGTNEAVLIYSATATIPGRADLQLSTTVVARQDIYADLHRIFAHTSDNNHLDMQPRYEFIDAVDADGDGRGELLFKQVGDSGTGYALYRVIGDRLWPLFESKPGS